jgi:hypothetical protein
MKPTALLLTLVAAAAALDARADPVVLIADARADARAAPTPPAPEAALLERVVRKEARAAWSNEAACSDAFAVLGRATGAFTTPGATQSAVLYRYCDMGRQIGMNGVAVLEAGRVAAHVVYQGGGETGITALPDLDGNGLAEIAIASVGSGQGTMQGGTVVVELGASGVRKLGFFITYRDNCGTEEPQLWERATVLYAAPGATPQFFAEGFKKPCDAAPARWQAVSARAPARADEDETSYRRLR